MIEVLENVCVQMLDVLYYIHKGGDLNTGYKGVTMTVKAFDLISCGVVDYDIFSGSELINFFTRDVSQDVEVYRRNLVKFNKYSDCTIFHVYTMNDVIHVSANLIDRSTEDEKVFEA